jgi:hypothetical protein
MTRINRKRKPDKNISIIKGNSPFYSTFYEGSIIAFGFLVLSTQENFTKKRM